MGRAKDIVLKVIPAKIANEFVKRWHYSGKVVQNSSLHFGAFLDGQLHGVMSYGSPLDKRKVLPLVHTSAGVPCLWNEMLELNRMAFDDVLPKNSESRCIAISFKLIKKNAPHIKWVLSFSDGTQCGDGAIYRGSGFELTSCKKNSTIIKTSSGKIISELSGGKHHKGTPIDGYQLRYIYLIDKTCKLNCPTIPFSKIDEIGAGMYKGEKITLAERHEQAQQAKESKQSATSGKEGGSSPTVALN